MEHIKDYLGKRIHLIGIGGSSMSGLAGMLASHGYTITGSDNTRSYLTDALEAQGITVHIGHAAQNVEGADLVVYSTAIREDNPERQRAAKLGIPQIDRATLLGQLMEGYANAINVCGTHGKTTTTSMIAEILLENGKDPTIHIGGQLDAIGGSTRVGGHETFVVEACEYNRNFLHFHPTIAVLLNIEEDHLDYYQNIEDIESAFAAFLAMLPERGIAVGNGDDARVARLLQAQLRQAITFGMGVGNDWHPERLTWDERGCAAFDAVYKGEVKARVRLSIPGEYNLMHALASMAACVALGVAPEAVAESLARFSAPHRRFELTGTVCGVQLYTDYGHNPAEMAGALQNAVHQPHRRIFAVMQPHTYSRVKTLFKDYIHCCDAADEILITDIFAAREKDPGDIHATTLVDAIATTGKTVHYTPTFDDAEAYLRANWQPGDLVITMSCGDIHLLNQQIQRHGEVWPKA